MPSRWLLRVELPLLSGQNLSSSGWLGGLDSEIGTLLVLTAAKNGSYR